MQIRVGTSGFSYKPWLGRFYPEKLPADEMLRYYAGQFATVEINNTFYRMPSAAMLEGWAREVPEHFSFTLKAPRRITHDQRLRDAAEAVAEFLRRAAILGDKLGMILFQLPPHLKQDLPRLRDFLAAVPSGWRIAIEFRNASWHDDAVYSELQARAVTLCVAQTDESDTPLVVTSDWAYLRLRRTQYTDAELGHWAERIAALPFARAYVYFKHEDEARGPRFALRFIELAASRQGQPGAPPPLPRRPDDRPGVR